MLQHARFFKSMFFFILRKYFYLLPLKSPPFPRQILEQVFEMMDADGELTLDVNEMGPFYQYAFDSLFGVRFCVGQA